MDTNLSDEAFEAAEALKWVMATILNLRSLGLQARFTLEELMLVLKEICGPEIEFKPIKSGAYVCGTSYLNKEINKMVVAHDHELKGESLLITKLHEFGHILNGDVKELPAYLTVEVELAMMQHFVVDPPKERKVQLLAEILRQNLTTLEERMRSEAISEWFKEL